MVDEEAGGGEGEEGREEEDNDLFVELICPPNASAPPNAFSTDGFASFLGDGVLEKNLDRVDCCMMNVDAVLLLLLLNLC
jgi:hypothetical protein